MELFEKVYGCYYKVVRLILEEAGKKPLSRGDMETIIKNHGFRESVLFLIPKLTDQNFPLLKEEQGMYCSALKGPAKLPLTNLQKSWLKSLLSDPRIRLFMREKELEDINQSFEGIKPLFSWEDFHYFDRYQDGDPYDSPGYQENFQTILTALSQKKPVLLAYLTKNKETVIHEVLPCELQYSSKDDKFRLLCLEHYRKHFSRETVLNLSRIEACHLSKKEVPGHLENKSLFSGPKADEPVVILINGERNSLERCMLHFARYEKYTEFDESKDAYICTISYDLADETELLIDILSFGPVIRVLGPEPFLKLIRQRVVRQHELFYGMVEA